MIVLHADHTREIRFPTASSAVRRPVDIDQLHTGFTILKTLRIYEFNQGVKIDGHAEEDEVFVIVLGGTIEITITVGELTRSSFLSVPDATGRTPCAAYLPPGAVYELVSKTDSVVAYARATPASVRQPCILSSSLVSAEFDVKVLLEEMSHGEHLRLRLICCRAVEDELSIEALSESEVGLETLVHVQITPQGNLIAAHSGSVADSVWPGSWDTVVSTRGEALVLRVPCHTTALILLVMAT
jgi:hypothetical protein